MVTGIVRLLAVAVAALLAVAVAALAAAAIALLTGTIVLKRQETQGPTDTPSTLELKAG